MLDCKWKNYSTDDFIIVIVNMKIRSMATYATIPARFEFISCLYWLNDEEIVVVTQGGLPYNEDKETVFYRMYRLNHKEEEASLILEWEYQLTRLTKPLQTFPMICSHPLVIKGNAYSVLQVGPEIILLPWDARFPSPSYPPIQIQIHIAQINNLVLLKPESNFLGVMGMQASWCNFYCLQDKIYLELEMVFENEDHPVRTRTDLFFELDLAQIDLTRNYISIVKESPNWSLVEFDRLSPGVEYNIRTQSTQDWQENGRVIKVSRAPAHLGSHVDVFVINLKDKSVSKETVEYHDRFARFTVYNNKYISWQGNEPVFQFQVQPSNVLPMQSLQQMCFEKLYLTSDLGQTKEKKK